MTAPALGGVPAGPGASVIGPGAAVALGGALCVATLALVGLFCPEPRRRAAVGGESSAGDVSGDNSAATATP
ncbi:hypothetical protein [Streptomyces sp. CAU 1734]|uniref:hypothetical protein n=1 Tax=Streptomyces sp. CAU 1734 TaxID=3140360 RepID=UPI0032614E62